MKAIHGGPLPLVSVVMPSMNQAGFIEASIDSVLGQGYPALELIVADGGSSDGTIALLERRSRDDSRLRWHAEPDSGPANALNKALLRAQGTIIGWLNSDDLFLPGAIARAVSALQANRTLLMVYGQGQHIDDAGVPLGAYPTLPPATPITAFAEGCFICQPTVFFRRSMWIMLGKLDEELKAAFDFDYWMRAFAAFPERIGFVDALQASSRLHRDGITLRLRRTVILEGMKVLHRHLGRAPKEWFLTYVHELLAESGKSGDDALTEQVMATLRVARQWLRDDDLRELEMQLKDLLK